MVGQVIVITGPIASGKSTVARELAGTLERAGVRAAVIDLDLVHDALPGTSTRGKSSWTLARRAAASAANSLAAEGVAVVIAEGSFNAASDRASFVGSLQGRSDQPVFVTLQVSFDEALRRAQSDPTRGRSRDPRFLGAFFVAWREKTAAIPVTDLVIDTERTSATAAATTIARLVRRSASDGTSELAPPRRPVP